MMRRKESYTNFTPIPSTVPRQLALDILHSHSEIITLNPLVLSHKAIKAPRDAAVDEYYFTWYEITERVKYVPGLGRMGSGKISFKGSFHDTPWGLQTHTYAPMGVDLRTKWRVAGNQPGEPVDTQEARPDGAPAHGLYLREDVEIECNLTLLSFVKHQLKAASKVLVDRLMKKAELLDAGVLQAMMEDGKLKTFNPADRSSTYAPPLSPGPPQDPMSPMCQTPNWQGAPTRWGSVSTVSHPNYASSPPQYAQNPGRSFAAELPADMHHPQQLSASELYTEVPNALKAGNTPPQPNPSAHYSFQSPPLKNGYPAELGSEVPMKDQKAPTHELYQPHYHA